MVIPAIVFNALIFNYKGRYNFLNCIIINAQFTKIECIF